MRKKEQTGGGQYQKKNREGGSNIVWEKVWRGKGRKGSLKALESVIEEGGNTAPVETEQLRITQV